MRSLKPILAIGAVLCLAACSKKESAAPAERPDFAAIIDPTTATSSEALLASGKKLYTQWCYNCHGVDGLGMPGMQPPLVGSEKLASDPYYVIEWVLRGSAMMGRQKSQWPTIMPGHKHLSDKEVAAIISYVRQEFGKGDSPVSAEMVKLVRDVL